MQLSICIITKNEQENIVRCLESLKPYAVEVVVVDTGSTDATREIATKYTDSVYDFVWCDDFSAAKNFAIAKAKYPYVMVLDSDEYIEEFDEREVAALLERNTEAVGRVRRRNFFSRKGQRQENHEWINRIFVKNYFRYTGRIHEQVTALDGAEYVTYLTPIVIGHTGYDMPKEALQQKAMRNITLLNQELKCLLQLQGVCSVQEDIERKSLPDAGNTIPYIVYQLGKSYYMAGDYEKACEYFAQGLSYDLNPKLEYVIDMVETYGYALVNSGRAVEALFFENIYEEFGDSADFQFLMGLIYMNNMRFEEAVEEFLKATQHSSCRGQGVNSFSAYYNIGVIYECLGDVDKAQKYYEQCGNYEPAKGRLSEIERQA